MTWAYAGYWSDAVMDDLGNALENVNVHVYAPGTSTPWPIYAGPGTDLTPITDVPRTDSLGNLELFGQVGWAQIEYLGFRKRILLEPDPIEQDARLASIAPATSSVTGGVRLTGDLGGTATSPTVPGLVTRAPQTVVDDLAARVAELEGAGTPAGPVGPVGDAVPWTLIFEDQFSGSSLDTTKWLPNYHQGGATGVSTSTANNERQIYRPSQVTVANGLCSLTAVPEAGTLGGHSYIYKSGIITSGPDDSGGSTLPAKFQFQYGYAEARAKIPAGKGLWPAFWMLPSDLSWPPEIDMMEVLGPQPSTLYTNYHYGTSSQTGPASYATTDLSQDFHVYAVDWTSAYLRWYLDGVLRAQYTTSSNITNKQMYLLLNLAIGGNWLDTLVGGGAGSGDPDGTTPNPAVMQIDWVRVWQRS